MWSLDHLAAPSTRIAAKRNRENGNEPARLVSNLDGRQCVPSPHNVGLYNERMYTLTLCGHRYSLSLNSKLLAK